MSVHGLGWLGVRTDRFEHGVVLYRAAVGLTPRHAGEGTGVHVYGSADDDHRSSGTAPEIGFAVDDAVAGGERVQAARLELLTGLERDREASWCLFRGPGVNVYELVSGVPRR